ncbi:MAG TPA: AMP-dependent synthetase, partial [Candidatus Atribacteria bacterium]|nr:AMP-dependent synthetase [Candidatus Atribacteria bacterium]
MLVNHFLENSAQRLPEKVCLVFKDKRFTYAEIDKVSNQLAHTLIELGIKRGDRVAIYIENSPEVVISLFGILKAGAIFSVLNPLIKPRKLQYILNNCQ